VLTRGVVNQALTASVQWGDFAAADPSPATSTVTVTKAGGTVLVTDAATTRTGPGAFQWPATGTSQVLTTPDLLSLVWKATFSSVVTLQAAQLEVAGGVFFSLLELKNSDPALASFSQTQLDAARVRAESDVEQVLGFAGVPRVAVERIVADQHGVIRTSWWNMRAVRSFTVNGTTIDVSTLTIDDPVITGSWRAGDVITVVYEHGLDAPPRDLAEATMGLARVRAQAYNSSVPDRAERFVSENGRTFVLSSPSAGKVGIPEVDSVLGRYKIPVIV